MTDYNHILRRIGIKQWVEQRGVKEVWIWGYHGGVVRLTVKVVAIRGNQVPVAVEAPKEVRLLQTELVEAPVAKIVAA
jgi:hypothetical protein